MARSGIHVTRLVVVLGVLVGLSSRASPTEVVRAGWLVDPASGTVAANQSLLVENGHIKAVGPNLEVPAGAVVIDLSNRYVSPGLIDVHTHLCLTVKTQGGQGLNELLRSLLSATLLETNARRALMGVVNAREMLAAGFTTVRDVGNAGNYADTDLRRSIEEGWIPGPTVINAGRIIAPLGGQYHHLQPERPDLGEPEYLYADTPEEMRLAVRKNVLFGAKVIKIVVDDQPYLYSVDDVRTRYYLRFQVHDRPGVLARLAGALGEAGVSIEQMVQEGGGGSSGEPVDIVMLTHDAVERDVQRAMGAIAGSGIAAVAPRLIRIQE